MVVIVLPKGPNPCYDITKLPWSYPTSLLAHSPLANKSKKSHFWQLQSPRLHWSASSHGIVIQVIFIPRHGKKKKKQLIGTATNQMAVLNLDSFRGHRHIVSWLYPWLISSLRGYQAPNLGRNLWLVISHKQSRCTKAYLRWIFSPTHLESSRDQGSCPRSTRIVGGTICGHSSVIELVSGTPCSPLRDFQACWAAGAMIKSQLGWIFSSRINIHVNVCKQKCMHAYIHIHV